MEVVFSNKITKKFINDNSGVVVMKVIANFNGKSAIREIDLEFLILDNGKLAIPNQQWLDHTHYYLVPDLMDELLDVGPDYEDDELYPEFLQNKHHVVDIMSDIMMELYQESRS